MTLSWEQIVQRTAAQTAANKRTRLFQNRVLGHSEYEKKKAMPMPTLKHTALGKAFVSVSLTCHLKAHRYFSYRVDGQQV